MRSRAFAASRFLLSIELEDFNLSILSLPPSLDEQLDEDEQVDDPLEIAEVELASELVDLAIF